MLSLPWLWLPSWMFLFISFLVVCSTTQGHVTVCLLRLVLSFSLVYLFVFVGTQLPFFWVLACTVFYLIVWRTVPLWGLVASAIGSACAYPLGLLLVLYWWSYYWLYLLATICCSLCWMRVTSLVSPLHLWLIVICHPSLLFLERLLASHSMSSLGTKLAAIHCFPTSSIWLIVGWVESLG